MGSPPKTDWPTLVTTYICSFVSLSFIFIRLLCRRMRGEKFMSFHDDVWMSISIIPLIFRLGVVHIVIVNGTNSISLEAAQSLAPGDVDRRVLGSKLVLASRVGYPAFLWCMKACMLAFLSRLMSAEPKYAKAIRGIGIALVVSFIGVILGTLLECHPFETYFMMPGPKCTKAFIQLTTMATLNIVTDLALIILPLPHIFKSHLPILRKVQLSLLFTVSFAVIIVTVVRMPLIVGSTAMQKSRTLWASIEILTSCIVANAPILNTFYYEWKKKRRGGSRKHTQMTGDQEADDDDEFTRRAYSMKSKPSPKIQLKRSRGSSGGGDQYSSTGSRTGKGHARDLSEESLTRSEGEREHEFVIETTTSVTQSVAHASPDTLRTQQSRYYKGDFLGTQVWADQVFPGPKDPTQHLNYGMNLSHQKQSHHHHSSTYSHNKRPSHTFTDIPSLGVLPSTPPRALLNAIANRKTVQNRANADSNNGDPSSSSSSSQGGGILRSFGRRGSRAMAGSEEELGRAIGEGGGLGIEGIGGSGGSSSSRSLVSDGGPSTPGIEMEHQHQYQHKSILG